VEQAVVERHRAHRQQALAAAILGPVSVLTIT
jgi:hypothetical protein